MAKLGDVYAALPGYRAALHQSRFDISLTAGAGTTPFRGAFSAFATPLSNVHATGIGIRVKNGKIQDENYVIKLYVFEKIDLGTDVPEIARQFEGVPVDVEHLPVQMALQRKRTRQPAAGAGIPPNRLRKRPVIGGLSIAPLGMSYVGTLGCFVTRRVADSLHVFALSNNHVLANVNSLAAGTPIVQPGPEFAAPSSGDVFAELSEFVTIDFATSQFNRPTNRFDAAIARVTDANLVKQGQMFGIAGYDPTSVVVAKPGMTVTKSGRTTGVTRGRVTAVGVNGVQINYGTQTNPRLATFNDTIEIVSDGDSPFSMPGDSGSVILEEASGKPVALLFAGDGHTTTACSFAGVCRQFQVDPV